MGTAPGHPFFGRWPLGQVTLPAHDLARAVAFYRDTLAVPFLFQSPALAFFDCDGVRLERLAKRLRRVVDCGDESILRGRARARGRSG